MALHVNVEGSTGNCRATQCCLEEWNIRSVLKDWHTGTSTRLGMQTRPFRMSKGCTNTAKNTALHMDHLPVMSSHVRTLVLTLCAHRPCLRHGCRNCYRKRLSYPANLATCWLPRPLAGCQKLLVHHLWHNGRHIPVALNSTMHQKFLSTSRIVHTMPLRGPMTLERRTCTTATQTMLKAFAGLLMVHEFP